MRGYFRTRISRIIGMAPPQGTFVIFVRFVVKINTNDRGFMNREICRGYYCQAYTKKAQRYVSALFSYHGLSAFN